MSVGEVIKMRSDSCPDKSHRQAAARAFARGETDFLMCGTCGLVFRENFPTPAVLEALYLEAYTENNIIKARTDQESGAFATAVYAKYLLRRLIRPGMRVLDYGAGSGELVALLRKTGVNAEGFEYSKTAREYCEKTRGFSLASDFDALPEESFDLVCMIEVIEHLTDLWETLSKLRKLLKPNGVLFITTPNRRSFRARAEKGFWREARKKFHLFLFDSASIAHHLRANGFGAVEVVRFGPVPRSGIKFWIFGRLMQLLSAPGTLCIVARAGGIEARHL
jgi:SAM-dependent methyltransferase